MGTGFHLTQTIRRAALTAPDRLATIDGPRTRTHAEHLARVRRIAGGLQGLGLGAGDRVAVLAMNSDRYLETYLATWWGGGAVAPLNTRWSPTEHQAALHHVGARILLVDDTFLPELSGLLAAAPEVVAVVHLTDGEPAVGTTSFDDLAADGPPVEDAIRHGEDLACVLFTGGTTGTPKGVMLSHDNVVAAGVGMRLMGCATSERLLHAAPLFHVGGIQMASAHWLGNGTHVLVPGFHPARVLAAIQEHRVTDLLLAPTMISMLLADPALPSHDLTSLKQVVYGTSPITPALLSRALAAAPSSSFVQGYGMTETGMSVMLPAWHHTPQGQLDGKLRSIGVSSPFAEVAIVDPTGRQLPRGEVGELVVRGPGVMTGYWQRPEETAEALRDGWMHSGDGAVMDADGFITLTDRIKDMIVTGGENVYSTEVESAVAAVPGVAAVAVIAVPHPVWIESVHAVVVRAPGSTVSAEAVIEHCRGALSAYKVPRSVEFVEELPVSAAGKILKAQLRRERRPVTA